MREAKFSKRAGAAIRSVMLATALAAPPAAAQQNGALSGTVVDEEGRPLAGALVFYNRVPLVQREPGGGWRVLPDLRSLVRTGPDGSFSVDVPPGGYYLCATGNTPRHLKSCEWGSGNRYIPASALAGNDPGLLAKSDPPHVPAVGA